MAKAEPVPMTAARAREWAKRAAANANPDKAAAWSKHADKLQAEEAGAWRNRADLA